MSEFMLFECTTCCEEFYDRAQEAHIVLIRQGNTYLLWKGTLVGKHMARMKRFRYRYTNV